MGLIDLIWCLGDGLIVLAQGSEEQMRMLCGARMRYKFFIQSAENICHPTLPSHEISNTTSEPLFEYWQLLDGIRESRLGSGEGTEMCHFGEAFRVAQRINGSYIRAAHDGPRRA